MAGLWSDAGRVGTHRPAAPRQWDELGSGPATLAEDLFLIMLDDSTGRLRVAARLAGYALTGGLLIDLWALGNVVVGPGRLAVADRPPPTDALLKRTLGRLLVEPERVDLREWVEDLGAVAVDEAADRLVRGGWLHRQQRGVLAGRHMSYPPVDRNAVFWRAGRLAGRLAREPTGADLALFGLVDAVGFTSAGLCDYGGLTRHHAVLAAARLSRQYPPVAEMTGHVRALTARAAISLR